MSNIQVRNDIVDSAVRRNLNHIQDIKMEQNPLGGQRLVITFNNGIILSTLFGGGTYSNYDQESNRMSFEIAIIVDGEFTREFKIEPSDFNYDDVEGWVSPEKLAQFIDLLSTSRNPVLEVV